MTQSIDGVGTVGFFLVCGVRELAMRRGGRYVVGRSPQCHLVLDDQMVSRRHARFIVDATSVVIEDLGSSNGVFVAGLRVEGAQTLRLGQRVQIGTHELVLRGAMNRPRQRHSTFPGQRRARPTLPDLSQGPCAGDSGPTDQINYFDVLGDVSDKLLARGQAEEAERLVSGNLRALLDEVRRRKTADAQFTERACGRALKLAAATGKASWLEYVFELYAALDTLLPEELIDESYRVVHSVERPSLDVLTSYVQRVDDEERLQGPSERFRVRRLRGLAQMLASL